MPSRRPERRNEESAKAIVRAALDLCREVGYDKLGIEGIAARAGVGKNTIYRWWPSKSAILLDGLLSAMTSAQSDFPDTGDVVADFKTQIVAACETLTRPDTAPHYAALIGAAQQDAELANAMWERLLSHLVAAAVDRIRHAQRQGQIRSDLDPDLIVELLYGPIYYGWLIRHSPPGREHIHTTVDTVFAGVAASSAEARSGNG
ncbi:TetR/AcrR family transcriptional regulator [Nocardia sp. NPDC050406]|uniref:TetR/AcrR family transcriptional regulator n=1 Tax=Nocardia sp. NPDC050406 TaxID=3364318 RepID=UPI0037A7D0BE